MRVIPPLSKVVHEIKTRQICAPFATKTNYVLNSTGELLHLPKRCSAGVRVLSKTSHSKSDIWVPDICSWLYGRNYWARQQQRILHSCPSLVNLVYILKESVYYLTIAARTYAYVICVSHWEHWSWDCNSRSAPTRAKMAYYFGCQCFSITGRNIGLSLAREDVPKTFSPQGEIDAEFCFAQKHEGF